MVLLFPKSYFDDEMKRSPAPVPDAFLPPFCDVNVCRRYASSLADHFYLWSKARRRLLSILSQEAPVLFSLDTVELLTTYPVK